MNTSIELVKDKLEASEFDKAFLWLPTTDPSVNHNAACGKHEPGTGDWLIKDSVPFKSWRDQAKQCLRLHGVMGCGRTVLCSSVIEHVKEHLEVQCTSQPEKNFAVAYFYFGFSDDRKLGVQVSCVQQLRNFLATTALATMRFWSYTSNMERKYSSPRIQFLNHASKH